MKMIELSIWSITTLFQAIYLLISASVLITIMIWLTNYIHHVIVVSKIPGLPVTLPIIGNLHYVKRREGQNLSYFCFKKKNT